jgi:transposase InsO family protein
MKYTFIEANRKNFALRIMTRVLSVTKAGYLAWKRRGLSARKQEDNVLREEIITIHTNSKRTYGAPRIKSSLADKGKNISRRRTNRLMREAGCETKYRKQFVRTTNSKHSNAIAENKLNREFQADKPNQKWVSDITYLHTSEGWLFLAVIMDLFSRKIVGWAFGQTLETKLVLNALWMARAHRKPNAVTGLLHHSDRGSQYASVEYRKALNELKATCSMSRRGNCWDNAVMESFFSTLKLELDLDKMTGDRAFTQTTVFSWIEGWYNRVRKHSSLGYLSPVEFEAKALN